MKPQLPQPERFTLPLSAAGERLATALCDAIKACERTVSVRHELMEVESEGGRLNVPLIIVEAGPRLREGEIAQRMKNNQANEIKTASHHTEFNLTEREREYVRACEANWLKMSTEVL